MKTLPDTHHKIQHAHNLYCQLTSQKLSLRFDRERLWYELLKLGFELAHIRKVILYLQSEIKEGRRNIGALKLSNLLQPDKFEEDLNISDACLSPPKAQPKLPEPSHTPMDAKQRLYAIQTFSSLRQKIKSSQCLTHYDPKSAKTL